ncbi:MAG: hypothetical protein OEW52_11995 [Thermoleophilia bacterium]|nr:hypothetical protein [Thermoleophilia bacterium]MDH4341374.1 hypothetical protein [Thermoleophilia bacterium]MDH5281847.1 hypothetical protein [Thermoleophilia bacterium]
MPQARKWKDNAEKQKAYRHRQKERRALAAAGIPLDDPVDSQEQFVQNVQQAGEDAIRAFFGRRE